MAQQHPSRKLSLPAGITSIDLLASAIMRATGSPVVVIDDPFVFIEDAAAQAVMRYEIPEHSRLILEALDRGEQLTDGIVLHLVPPSEGAE